MICLSLQNNFGRNLHFVYACLQISEKTIGLSSLPEGTFDNQQFLEAANFWFFSLPRCALSIVALFIV
jgi:hypothetical protein